MKALALRSGLAWLIRDTFRQAQAFGLFYFLIAVTVLCVLLCLTAQAAAPDGAPSDAPTELRLVFGNLRVPIQDGDQLTAVHKLQLILAGWVADAAGLLVALIWTAGFLPTFLEPQAIAVLLVKPAPRWFLLLGKFLGVMVFVTVQVTLFIAATWLALALRTGVWDAAYFRAIPLLLLHFGVFFSFSTMLAVATRSTVVCIFGSLFFWLLCWALNFGRHAVLLVPDLQNSTVQSLSWTANLGYWVLPKPLDFHLLLQNMLGVDQPLGPIVDLHKLTEVGAWLPGWSLTASCLFALVMLVLAVSDFLTTEY
jgi:ABC-type transport system involved in multi-copper enzyme maturation permease subunit